MEIVIENVCYLKKADIVCYKDASYTSLSCKSSKWAKIFLLGNGEAVRLAYQSKMRSQVIKSLLVSEAMALGTGKDANHPIAS